MKYYHNHFRILGYTMFALVYIVFGSSSKAVAQEVACNEASLRNLSVAMLNCTGTGPECSTGNGPISMTSSTNIPEPHKAIIERAASKFSVNPNFIAALYLSEQGNEWRPLEGPYATSRAGASGPFQFMPGTWAGYKQDGNGDGVADIQNFEDAAYAASKLAASGTNQSTPLGTLDKPFTPNTLVLFSAVYNWGGGNVQRKTSPDSPISAAPKETQNYMKNIHALISSDFTVGGHENYGPPRMPGQDLASPTTGGTTSGCVSTGTSTQLVTSDAEEARRIIFANQNIIWGNYGSATSQKDDVRNCLSTSTLIALATMAENSGVDVPINAMASDHGGCTGGGGSFHNSGKAIDIGYYGNNSQGQDRHTPEGDEMYKFLFDNRVLFNINELIWQYPPIGYQCMDESAVGECDEIFSAATMNEHYHHIHVSFND